MPIALCFVLEDLFDVVFNVELFVIAQADFGYFLDGMFFDVLEKIAIVFVESSFCCLVIWHQADFIEKFYNVAY